MHFKLSLHSIESIRVMTPICQRLRFFGKRRIVPSVLTMGRSAEVSMRRGSKILMWVTLARIICQQLECL